ncbi:MAG: methylcobalamin:coenzyme M methyltransferase [Planctomycetes bacterium ADurb.Bin126]|nr:MAG: methylcobalamin:coenzyme M methyltransferase [Planctomycetes bacterium ADurb.Bin126]HOD79799.1 uroporphyrinogen decarboxylase family protein [Phycisphaerae bacterium]HQL72807.1 uroporphyrinogen decarboxylase family protein [Phycisphaerae bacterium]
MSRTETMTPRQRVLTALDHKQPDRVPIDLGGNQTGIHRDAYRELIRHLGMNGPVEIMDAVQQLAKPSEELLQRFRVDTRYIAAGAAGDWKGGIVEGEHDGRRWFDLVDEFGVRWSMPAEDGLYMDITHHPLANATIEDVKAYPFPRGDDPGRFVGLRERALELKNHTPYAVVSGICGVVYEVCWYMRGLEQWYVDLMTEPEFCQAVLDQTLKFWMDWFRVFLDEVGDVVDVIMIGDDLAGQQGPLFRPALYRQLVKPRHKRLVQYIRSRTKAKIWYHTCGNCTEYIGDLVDNGVDILNPVQISAADMDPGRLKREFGERLTFWGGAIDAQRVLPRATPDQVREHVRRNIELFKPGGGYVFNNVHNIQAGVPPENIVAMYDAAYEYGWY